MVTGTPQQPHAGRPEAFRERRPRGFSIASATVCSLFAGRGCLILLGTITHPRVRLLRDGPRPNRMLP